MAVAEVPELAALSSLQPGEVFELPDGQTAVVMVPGARWVPRLALAYYRTCPVCAGRASGYRQLVERQYRRWFGARPRISSGGTWCVRCRDAGYLYDAIYRKDLVKHRLRARIAWWQESRDAERAAMFAARTRQWAQAIAEIRATRPERGSIEARWLTAARAIARKDATGPWDAAA